MAKVKVVVTHEEYGEVDLGDVPPEMFAQVLKGTGTGGTSGDWSLSDINADWRMTKVEIDGKEF